MSAGEWAAIVGAVCGVITVGLLTVLTVNAVSTMREVQTTVVDLRAEALPLIKEGRATIESANEELAKVDALLDTAQSVSGTVDNATKLAYGIFATPAIKGSAIASGVSRGISSLFKGDGK